MTYDNTNKGALWNKTAKSWLSYISWTVNVEWVEYNISMFNNDKKWNEARPDYNIVLEARDKPKEVTDWGNASHSELDGIPF